MDAPLVNAREVYLQQGRFAHTRYIVKRPFWSIFGRKFNVYAPDGSLVAFVKHPLFKLREEFTIYTDESETDPLLTLKARKVIQWNVCHDVFDAKTGEKTGTLRKRGWKSILRDTWDVLDANDQPVGLMQEDGAAFLRRMFPILTSKHHIELAGVEVARIRQVFRFFVKEFTLDLSMSQGRIDTRFAIACTLLALMAESRRESRN
jgi:uncharacterized protein YxjI